MKFPNARVIISGRYVNTQQGLVRVFSVDRSLRDVANHFEAHSESLQNASHRSIKRKIRRCDIMTLTEDRKFIWWRYRLNNKDPEVKYYHEFTKFERYMCIASPYDCDEYIFDTNHNRLLSRLANNRNHKRYKIIRICKDYIYMNDRPLDLYGCEMDDYYKALDDIKSAVNLNAADFYYECMRHVAAEVNIINIENNAVELSDSFWQYGDDAPRCYLDFKDPEKCEKIKNDIDSLFDPYFEY